MKAINRKQNIYISVGVLIVFVVFVVFAGRYWYSLKMEDVRMSSGQAERRDPVPKELQGSQIVLNIPMYYRIGAPDFEQTKTVRSINRKIVPKVVADAPRSGITYELIPDGMKFTITGALYIGYPGFRIWGPGDPGEFLLLRDENGVMSYVNLGDLRWNVWTSGGTGSSLASYYKNGILVGGVDKIDWREWDSQFSPKISFWQVMFNH